MRYRRAYFVLFLIFTASTHAMAMDELEVPENQRCDIRRNPHSFACSVDTFNGRVFPMVELEKRSRPLVRSWNLQLLVAPRELGDPRTEFDNFAFETRFLGGDVRRPQMVVWKGGTGRTGRFGPAVVEYDRLQRLEKIKIDTGRMDRFGRREVFAFDFSFFEKSSTRLTTAVFKEVHGKAELRCRVFKRVQIDHLSCAWIEFPFGNLQGLFGFTPSPNSN